MISLSREELEESVVIVQNSLNSKPIEILETISKAIMPMQGENTLVDQAIGDCRKLQDGFNTLTESLTGYVESFNQTLEVTERVKQLSVESVTAKDNSFATAKVDAASVRV